MIHQNTSSVGHHSFINILDKIVKSYNTRPHRMLDDLSPQFAEENPDSSRIAIANMDYMNKFYKFKSNPRFKIGDRVRVIKQKDTFDYHYDRNFNEEYYKVIELIPHMPINLYKIESLDRKDDDKVVDRFMSISCKKLIR